MTVRRAIILIVALAAILFTGAGAYAFFTSSGSGNGTALSGPATFPAPDVDPAGAPDFNLVNMAPGQTDSQSVTVTAPGAGPSATQIAIYEPDASGALLPALKLKVVEDGSNVLYDGPLATGWTSASPLVVPGTATTGLWDAGEQHTFVFTVTFTAPADNSSQSASATADFVWARTQG